MSAQRVASSIYTGPPPAKQGHYEYETKPRYNIQSVAMAHYGTVNRVPQNLSALQGTAVSYSHPRPADCQFWTKKKVDRMNTGLRHFSTKVCEKVKSKGQTNYNEVADELVNEYFQSLPVPSHLDMKQQFEMKNIRRRVYDALNVLLAMNIIEKNKKDIRWVGLPATSGHEIKRLEDEKTERENRIKDKLETLQDLIIELVTFRALVERNKKEESENGPPPASELFRLPFIIMTTDKQTNVECSVANDKTEYLFSFDKPYQIHDACELMRRMDLAFGLERGECSEEQKSEAKRLLPPVIRHFVDDIVDGHKYRVAQGAKLTPEPAQVVEESEEDGIESEDEEDFTMQKPYYEEYSQPQQHAATQPIVQQQSQQPQRVYYQSSAVRNLRDPQFQQSRRYVQQPVNNVQQIHRVQQSVRLGNNYVYKPQPQQPIRIQRVVQQEMPHQILDHNIPSSSRIIQQQHQVDQNQIYDQPTSSTSLVYTNEYEVDEGEFANLYEDDDDILEAATYQ